jgi:antitoxin HicB
MAKSAANRAHNGGKGRKHAIATKRTIVRHLNEALIERQKTKQALAEELQTSRSQLARLLDPENVAVSLETIARAAAVLGKRIVFFVEDLDCPPKLNFRTSNKPVKRASVQGVAPSQIEEIAS